MTANVYEELAEQFGVTVQYITDLASQGRLHEFTAACGYPNQYGSRGGQDDDVEQGIYERAKRLEQTRQSMPEGHRALADLEARMQRILREEVYDVARGRA